MVLFGVGAEGGRIGLGLLGLVGLVGLVWSMQVMEEGAKSIFKTTFRFKPYVYNFTHTGLLVTLALSENIRLELHLFLQQVVEGLDLLGSARWESRVTSLLVARPQQLTSAATTSAAAGHLRGMVLMHGDPVE